MNEHMNYFLKNKINNKQKFLVTDCEAKWNQGVLNCVNLALDKLLNLNWVLNQFHTDLLVNLGILLKSDISKKKKKFFSYNFRNKKKSLVKNTLNARNKMTTYLKMFDTHQEKRS